MREVISLNGMFGTSNAFNCRSLSKGTKDVKPS